MTPDQRARALRLADTTFAKRDHDWHMDANALLRELAAEPVRVPLTHEQVQQLLTAHFDDDTMCGDDMTLVRAVERAHGITGDAK